MTTHEPSFHLSELHLYNWGAFAGRHQALLDAGNTAIIGPTGSGKTTLIDALMTLLCASPRYNLASTGGHESDRDLVSYVRGATGPGHSGDDSRHLARSGRTVTAIAARLVRGEESVLLGALFWLDGTSSSASDMAKRWFFAQGSQHSMDAWLEEHHRGGARALTQLEKNTEGLQIFANKKQYLARLQRFFEVGPNAFVLLNRAAGLKQLNSIDEIFRELVLDDHSSFEHALEVVASFDQLASIHADLEVATRQFLALLPLRDLEQQADRQAGLVEQLQCLKTALPAWFAQQGLQLWQARCQELQREVQALQQQCATAGQALQQARQQEQDAFAHYLQAGGNSIEMLRSSITTQKGILQQREQALLDYIRLARNLALTLPRSQDMNAGTLAAQQAQARAALDQLEAQAATLQEAAEAAVTAERNAHAQLQEWQQELQEVRARPHSNVPANFQQFRADLAQHLQCTPEDLPFVAELVEVPAPHQAWRGAIERALGSHRLRILVPPTLMRDALAWVNQRHNRLHVRLLEARADEDVTFWDDGFARKLNLRPHAHSAALRQLLAALDRHCVADVEALAQTPHAMTQQGLMSGKAYHFDKQDQRRLDQDWMTGFDNRDRLAQLTAQITQAEAQWKQLDADKRKAQQALGHLREQRVLWERLLELRYELIDVAGPQAEIQRLQEQLDALLDPQSDTAQAQQRWEAAQAHTQAADRALRQLEQQTERLGATHDHARQQCAQLAQRVADTPAPALDEHLIQLLPQGRLPQLHHEQLHQQEREMLTKLQERFEQENRRLHDTHKELIRQMGKALKEDTGALADHSEDLAELPHFLARLQVLEEEALPEKRARFQEYLNNASDQGVSTLLKGIETQVTEIQERIDALNQTLLRVDFQPGRYLQLDPQPVVHQSLQELNKAMAHLRTERLRDDGGNSHYQALRAMVELLREHATRRTKASQALLDARYRLQFAVQVLDRASGQVLERRTGSQGGSGGEKEIIASYVLTASLSYALCPQGRNRPLFGSIVLDEAFSKSSQAVAARIIQALREFGLHALFVTPNKEMRLLRDHTRSAVLVHRRGQQASLICLSWQELQERAQQRQASAASAPA